MPTLPSQTAREILVVDDESSTRVLLQRYLRDAGYSTVAVADGQSALRVLGERDIRLMITDWLMPEPNGVELCRCIRAHEGVGMIYIIMLTVQARPKHIVEALDAGADDYLTKPFHRDELLARVRVGLRCIDLQARLADQALDVHRCNAQLAQLAEKLTTLASTDELTGLCNRRETLARLEGYWATAQIRQQPLSTIMADIDHFKSINDRCGHASGDRVLVATAEWLRSCCRETDIVARFGGEEFLIICPNQPLEQAAELAHRICHESNIRIPSEAQAACATLSLGVAEMQPSMRSPADLLRQADDALYIAKRAGRNQVHVAQPTTAPAKPTVATTELEERILND